MDINKILFKFFNKKKYSQYKKEKIKRDNKNIYETIIKKIPSKFNIGVDIFICYSPERNDPGLKTINLDNIPKIISGYSYKINS